MAEELNINYYETSALNGTGINEAFEGLTKKILLKKKVINSDSRTVSLTSSQKPKKKEGCC